MVGVEPDDPVVLHEMLDGERERAAALLSESEQIRQIVELAMWALRECGQHPETLKALEGQLDGIYFRLK